MTRRFFRLVARQVSVQYRVRTFNLYSLLLYFLQPAIFSGVGIILSHAAGRETPDLVYTVLGGGMLGMWSGLVFSSTFDINRDRRDGMLEIIVGSPTSLWKVEGIRTFANVMAGLVSMLGALLVAVLVYHYSFSSVNLPGALISLLLLLLALWCIGVFLANFLVWSRLSGTMVDFLELPVAVLCGFMYPISVLPAWMQAISAALPIRWALQALNACLLGASTTALLWRDWTLALGISLLFLWLAQCMSEKVHDLIRVSGELNSI
jgi:ABC-2 type transport system permease protein